MTMYRWFLPLLFVSMIAGCSHSTEDKFVLEEPWEIPERPGLIEAQTGKKTEISF